MPQEPSSLESGFANPPQEARPLVWWHWINGNVTKAGIEADLADLKRVGIAGAQMFDASMYLPPGPVRYGTDQWHEHVQFAIRTADKLGLELDLMNAPGWSGSGGPWIMPERAMKRYAWTETEVEGGQEVSVKLPQPKAKLGFYRDVAVLAVPGGASTNTADATSLKAVTPVALKVTAEPIATNQVLILTASMKADGALRCVLPPGRWTLLRFGFTVTGSMNHPAQPEGHGLECDKLDADTVTFQFEQSLGRIIREAGPLAGKSLRGVLFDSFEGGFQNWTESLPQQFLRLKGYDLVPWLPVLTGRAVGSQAEAEAFLRDFRSAVGEGIAQNYFGTMQRLAHAHGLRVYAEAQGGPLDPVVCNNYVDVPMNEFWMPSASERLPRLKMVASAAKALGRQVVGAEAFTSKPEDDGLRISPAMLKRPGDEAFTAGVNRFILHYYVHQPYADVAPGFTLGRYGTHFGRLNTWWPFAGAWVDYVSRCQFLLQQGQTVADVCFLLNEDFGYDFPTNRVSLQPGYDYDICYPRQLMGMTQRNGALRSSAGASYRLLALPACVWSADVITLRHVLELVKAGAVITGEPPAAPFGLRDCAASADFKRLVSELWGGLDGQTETSKALGKGRVFRGLALADALRQTGVAPDVSWPSSEGPERFRYTHRRTADTDLYFVLNDSERPASTALTLRERGRQPEVWDAVAGTHADAPDFTPSDSGTTVPLQLEPWGSAFVVFRDGRRAPEAGGRNKGRNVPELKKVMAVPGPWEVSFDPKRGGPGNTEVGDQRAEGSKEGSVIFEKLADWSTHDDPRIRYYSGTATYRRKVVFSDFRPPASDARVYLDLGRVCDVAEVRINGQSAGVLWTPPFRVDISRWALSGENVIEVRVANQWVNRLIGDERIPVEYAYQVGGGKFTEGALQQLPEWLGKPDAASQNKRHTFMTWRHYTADSPLLPSGLLGPVTWECRTRTP